MKRLIVALAIVGSVASLPNRATAQAVAVTCVGPHVDRIIPGD